MREVGQPHACSRRSRFSECTETVRCADATAATRRTVLLCAAISLAMPAPSLSQAPVVVVPGDSVRVWTTAGYAGSGSVLDADSATIRWVTDLTDATLTTAAGSIRRLEVHRGYRRLPGRGALVGTLGGVVVAALFTDHWHAENLFFSVTAGIMVGLPLGAVFGMLTKADVWKDAALPGSPQVRLLPAPLGVRVTLPIR